MSDYSAYIELQVMGYEQAIANMKNMESAVKSLNGKKVRVELEARVDEIRKQLAALQSEKVNLKVNIEANKVALNQVSKELDEVLAKIQKSQGAKLLLKGADPSAISNMEEFNNLTEQASELTKRKYDLNVSTEKAKQGLKDVTNAEAQLRNEVQQRNAVLKSTPSFSQIFKGSVSTLRQVGGSLQTLGRTLTNISRPFQTLMRGTVFAAGQKLLSLAQSGISGAAERYDTFATYEKSLDALGYDAGQKFAVGTNKAQTAIENLNDAVLGLPTGLDEIVQAQKKYLAASGDMEKSTKAAIAANNLFLAQGSDQKDQLRGARQLRNMLSGGAMTKARWQSVVESMPMAVKAVGEELGYSGDKMDEFRQKLLDGKIAADDFMDAFLKAGTTGTIADATNEMKHTFSAASANIENAFRRMGQGILQTLNETLKSATGKDAIDMMIGLKDVINDLSDGVQNWIRSNSDVFIDFLNTLKDFPWKEMLQGMGDGILQMTKQLTGLFNVVDGKKAYAFGKFISKAGMYGKAFTILGGAIRGMAYPLAALYAFIKIKKAGGTTGIIGEIMSTLGTNKELTTATTQLPKIKSFGDTARGIFQSLSGAIKVAGVVGIATGTGVVAFKGVKTMLKDLGEIIDLADDIDWGKGLIAIEAISGFIGGLSLLFNSIGKGLMAGGTSALAAIKPTLIVGAITTLVTGFVALDTWLINKSVQNVRDAVDGVSQIIDTLNSIKDTKLDGSTMRGLETTFKTIAELPKLFKDTSLTGLLTSIVAPVGKAIADENDAKRMKEIVTGVVDSIEQLVRLNSILDSLGDFKGITEEVQTKISDAFIALGDIYKTINKALGQYTTVTNAEKISEILTQTEESMTTLKDLGELMPKVYESLESLMRIQYDGSSVFGKVEKNIGDFFEGLSNIYGAIPSDIKGNEEKSFKDVLLDIVAPIAALIGDGDNTQGFLDNIKGVFDTVKTIADGMSELYISLDSTMRTGYDGSTLLSKVTSQIQPFFEGLDEIYEAIPTDFKNKWQGKHAEQAGVMMENIKSLLSSLIGEDGIVAQVKQLAENMPGIMDDETGNLGESLMSEVKSYLEDFFTLIDGIYQSISGTDFATGDIDIASVTEGLSTAFENIKSAVEKIQGMSEVDFSADGIGGIVESIKSMIDQMSTALDIQKINLIHSQVELFKAAVDNLMTSVEQIGGSPVDVTITVNGTIKGMDSTIASIKSINRRIQAAVDAIQTTYSKDVYITIKRHYSLTGIAPSIFDHTGGYISNHGVQYRAGGGSIFKKRGTDIVPAMLTPGEYVVNKKATSTFGIDFMRKINNLDIGGAMQALQARISSGMLNGTRQVINNNTVNNNQRLTQNVYTNNPSFAYRRTSRYMGAI